MQRALPADEEKLADSLNDLHIQKVKEQQPAHLKLSECKKFVSYVNSTTGSPTSRARPRSSAR